MKDGPPMSDSGSRAVTVKIYDREYLLRTTGDAAALLELAEAVDARMREIARSSSSVDTQKAAILAALSFADEVRQAREQLREMDETLGQRSLECVSLLDHFLHHESA
jgi:cell division protein ZapA